MLEIKSNNKIKEYHYWGLELDMDLFLLLILLTKIKLLVRFLNIGNNLEKNLFSLKISQFKDC